MIVGTWQSTYVIFNLVKKPLVLVKSDPRREKSKKRDFFMFQMKKIKTRFTANIPTVIHFFFRFGLSSLYTVVFGRFPIPKKCNCWPKKWILGTFF